MRVGISIINYNSASYLQITLRSIIESKSDVEMSIVVFDNGSNSEDKRHAEAIVSSMHCPNNISISFKSSDSNLGFAGANNIAIKHFLENTDVTHILLLNNDVCVSDYWLDMLIEKKTNIVAPVTNAAGNEQTISIGYSHTCGEDIFQNVSFFAEKRRKDYFGCLEKTDFVTFFCALIEREVFEDVGFLDERFFPGGYEDDDFCLRAVNAGFEIAVARDCFVHHFGSGSFSQLEPSLLTKLKNANKQRFEKKWGGDWQDRHWKLILSCRQDIDYLSKTQETAESFETLVLSLRKLEEYYQNVGSELEQLRLLRSQPFMYALKKIKRKANKLQWKQE